METPPQRVVIRQQWNISDVLVTTGLVGCVIAICMRLQTMEQRLVRLEDREPRDAPKVFRPVVHACRPPSQSSSEGHYTPMDDGAGAIAEGVPRVASPVPRVPSPAESELSEAPPHQ